MNFETLNHKTTYDITYPVIKESAKEKLSWCDCLRKIIALTEEFQAKVDTWMESIMQREKDMRNRMASFVLTPSISEKLLCRTWAGMKLDNQGVSVSSVTDMLSHVAYLHMRDLALRLFIIKSEGQLYLSKQLTKNIYGESVSGGISMLNHDLRLDNRKIVASIFKAKCKGNLCLWTMAAKKVKKKPNESPKASHRGHFKAYPLKRIHADNLFFSRLKPLWRSYRETEQMRKIAVGKFLYQRPWRRMVQGVRSRKLFWSGMSADIAGDRIVSEPIYGYSYTYDRGREARFPVLVFLKNAKEM